VVVKSQVQRGKMPQGKGTYGSQVGRPSKKESYAQNPYGPSNSYAGKGTLLTGYNGGDKQEESVLTSEKPQKKPNTVSKKKTAPQKIVQYV